MSRKTVINVADGKELGHVCDMIFNNCGGVIGFVVPGKKSFFKSITSSDNVFIPWNRIIKIGSDVILVELVGNSARTCATVQDTPVEAESYDTPQDAPEYTAYAQAQPAPEQDYNTRYNCPQNAYGQASTESTAQTVYHDAQPHNRPL